MKRKDQIDIVIDCETREYLRTLKQRTGVPMTVLVKKLAQQAVERGVGLAYGV